MDALGRGLLTEFPNPQRTGCPGSDVLKKIASREMQLSEAEQWLDHLGSCSPCYRDFCQFRDVRQRLRKRTLFAIAASILVVASLAGWALIHQHESKLGAQTAVVDLRNWSVTRGVEPNPGAQPLEVSRATSKMKILLPVGSDEGPYDIRIVTRSGQSLLVANGMSSLKDRVISLQVEVSFSRVPPGSYILQIRKDDLEWNSYPVVLR